MSTESRRVQIILNAIGRFPAASAAGMAARVGATQRDDCAILPWGHDHDLVIGSDFVRGEGFGLFKLGLLTRKQVGAYVVGANASDLAAMGARPIGMTLIYRYQESTSDEAFSEIIDGVTEACQQYRMPLLGGDTGGYECPVLSATAFGVCPRGRALLRSGGAEGDDLYVTGDVGRAGAAYRYFERRATLVERLSPQIESELLEPWRAVRPALEEGQLLLDEGLSRCALDTSDGLFAASQLLAEASRLDLVLNAEALPIPDSVKAAAEVLGMDAVELGGGVSVDFRLLFSAPRRVAQQVRSSFEGRGWPLYHVGFLQRAQSDGFAYLEDRTGKRTILKDRW